MVDGVDVEGILVPIPSHQPHPRPMHRHRPRPRPRPIRPIHHAHHPHVLRPRLCHAPRVSCSVSSRAARCQSRVVSAARCRLELLDVSRVVRSVSVAACFAQSPRREESRVIASSVVSRRLSQSPRREKSRASPRLSSRVVCPLVVRRPAARRQSVVRSVCESRPFFLSLLGVSRVVCGVLPPRAVRRSVPFSFSDSMDDVFFRPVLTRRVFFLF